MSKIRKIIPFLLPIILLSSCGTTPTSDSGNQTQASSQDSKTLKEGDPCDQPNFLSNDGKLSCTWHGTGYWTSRDNATQISNGIFEASADLLSSENDSGVICPWDFSSAKPGDIVECKFYILVANVGHVPYDVAGNIYLIVDDSVYSGQPESKRYNGNLSPAIRSFSINPGLANTLIVWASIPYGSVIKGAYLASSPLGEHILDAPFNVLISN